MAEPWELKPWDELNQVELALAYVRGVRPPEPPRIPYTEPFYASTEEKRAARIAWVMRRREQLRQERERRRAWRAVAQRCARQDAAFEAERAEREPSHDAGDLSWGLVFRSETQRVSKARGASARARRLRREEAGFFGSVYA